jgi:predicted ferric reductase
MVFHFALVSRVRSVSSAFGQDALAQFHRQMGYIALLFVAAHPVALCLNGYPWSTLDPWEANSLPSWRWGAAAFYGLLLLVGLVLWRKIRPFSYEWWRLSHAVLATLVVLGAVAHIWMIENYTASRPMKGLWVLYLVIFLGLTVWYRLVRPLRQWRRPWTVVENIAEDGRAHTLVLRPQGHAGMQFEPGQFAWLTLGNSPFHFEQHPISISSSAELPPSGDVAFTIKALGDWSSKVVPGVKPGTRVWVDGPFGVFSPDQEQGFGYVLIAGGIGIAPMRSMCRTLADREDLRPVILFFGARDLEHLTYREELDRLAARMNLKIVYVPEHPPASWQGESGFITEEVLRRHLPRQFRRFQYFVCGPIPLMDSMERVLPRLGIPWQRVHTERFDIS